MCGTLWFFITFSVSLHLGDIQKKVLGGELIVTPLGIRPNEVCPFLLSFLLPSSVHNSFFFPCLAERALECSLRPSHWQMLLWNVMKFEMGAAVTIILGHGLSVAWYHYLWQLESAMREGERDGKIGWQAAILLSFMGLCVGWKAKKVIRSYCVAKKVFGSHLSASFPTWKDIFFL